MSGRDHVHVRRRSSSRAAHVERRLRRRLPRRFRASRSQRRRADHDRASHRLASGTRAGSARRRVKRVSIRVRRRRRERLVEDHRPRRCGTRCVSRARSAVPSGASAATSKVSVRSPIETRSGPTPATRAVAAAPARARSDAVDADGAAVDARAVGPEIVTVARPGSRATATARLPSSRRRRPRHAAAAPAAAQPASGAAASAASDAIRRVASSVRTRPRPRSRAAAPTRASPSGEAARTRPAAASGSASRRRAAARRSRSSRSAPGRTTSTRPARRWQLGQARVRARSAPSTTTDSHAAVENRRTTAPSVASSSVARGTTKTIATSPPSQTAADVTCARSTITASQRAAGRGRARARRASGRPATRARSVRGQ